MKHLYSGYVLGMSLFLALVSCTDDKNPAQQYGNTVIQTYKRAQKLDAKVNVQQIQKSVQEFYASNGRYPADLDELSSFCGLTLKSENYEYDSSNGTLTERK